MRTDYVEITGEIHRSQGYLTAVNSKLVVLSRVSGIVAVIMTVLCISITLVMQSIRPGYNPWQDCISALVWGPYGWLQTLAFFLLSFPILSLGIKLFRRIGTSITYKVGAVFIFLMGVAITLIGVLPTDVPGYPTTTGFLHLVTSGTLVCFFPPACFLMTPSLKKYFSGKWVPVYTWAAGVLAVILIGITGCFNFGNLGWIGMLERLIMLNALIWVLIMNLRFILSPIDRLLVPVRTTHPGN
jgi:hypothetical protein